MSFLRSLSLLLPGWLGDYLPSMIVSMRDVCVLGISTEVRCNILSQLIQGVEKIGKPLGWTVCTGSDVPSRDAFWSPSLL